MSGVDLQKIGKHLDLMVHHVDILWRIKSMPPQPVGTGVDGNAALWALAMIKQFFMKKNKPL